MDNVKNSRTLAVTNAENSIEHYSLSSKDTDHLIRYRRASSNVQTFASLYASIVLAAGDVATNHPLVSLPIWKKDFASTLWMLVLG